MNIKNIEEKVEDEHQLVGQPQIHIHHHHHHYHNSEPTTPPSTLSPKLDILNKSINDLSLSPDEASIIRPKPNFEKFRKRLDGSSYMASDVDYEIICNDRWDQDPINKPIIIVRPINDEDVSETINFVSRNKLGLAIKTSGHNIVSATDGGVSLDLSLMKQVVVNEDDQTVTVEPGCTFHDIDEITSQYGLATPLGQISSIGIGGFSTGGGLGHLTKGHGLSSDNLIECEIITADGIKRRCNQHKNKDLFWAVRGAGGFVGEVVSFTFKCYPITNVIVGSFTYNIDTTSRAVDALIEVGIRHLDQNDPLVYVININPGFGQPDTVLIKTLFLNSQQLANGKTLIENFQNLTNPTTSSITTVPFTSVQWEFDGLIAPGKYFQEGPMLKSTITPEVASLLLQAMSNRVQQTFSSIIITEVGGAVNQVSPSETAFPVRNSTFNIFFTSVLLPGTEESVKSWTINSINSFNSSLIAGQYINTSYSNDMRSIFLGNYIKLRKIKSKYDPNNIFRSL